MSTISNAFTRKCSTGGHLGKDKKNNNTEQTFFRLSDLCIKQRVETQDRPPLQPSVTAVWSRMLKQQAVIQQRGVMQKDWWGHTCLSPQSVMTIYLHSVVISQCQQAPHNLPKKETQINGGLFLHKISNNPSRGYSNKTIILILNK